MREIITSKDNNAVKLYQKLVTSKKARNDNNLFPLEGVRLCIDAVRENSELHCVFISESAEIKYSEAVNFIREKIDSKKIYIISDDLSSKITDTKNAQGIFAICQKLDKIINLDKILNNGKFVILNNIQDPGNLGTIIRSADATGIDALFLTDDCCDIYNSKVIRSTMGSIFRLPFKTECNISELLNEFKAKKIKTYAAVIDKDAISLTECNFEGSSAVVIGNEGKGLPTEISSYCDYKLTIKMHGNIDSLNAAMAAGIIMWEMVK